MSKERLYLFDTTLRDGAQTNGVDFTLEDKVLVAGMLDDLGIDYVEGGYPGANPTDTAFFEAKRTSRAAFTAFGMTKRAGVSLSNDPGLRALIDASADAICFVAKTWDYQVRVALGSTEEENLDGIRQSVTAAKEAGREVLLDCEHFFDGYKANPDYALACAKAAYDAGARWVVLCDTNGGTLPEEVEAIVAEVAKVVPGDHLGIHAHNDTDQAVANSLAAVRAGARQIQGTLNGIGERCGNANLTSLIPTLMLKPRLRGPLRDRRQRGGPRRPDRARPPLRRAGQPRAQPAGALCRRQRLHHQGRHPRLGASPRTRRPTSTCRPKRSATAATCWSPIRRARRTSWPSCRAWASRSTKDDRRLDALLREVKEREAIGYAYEGAGASFELLARRLLGGVPDYFDVEGFHVTVERRHNALGKLVSVSEAVVKIVVGGERLLTVAEGNGPVNALDQALRKDLGVYRARHRRPRTGRLQGAYPQRRHRGGDPRADRVAATPAGDSLVHRRRVGEHRRRLVRGAQRFDHLQAVEIWRRASLPSPP